MKIRLSILYSWLVRTLLLPFPNIPFVMRFHGFLYSLMMKRCGKNFQVNATAILNSLARLEFGDHVYIGPNAVIMGTCIKISDEVLVGPNVMITSANHSLSNHSYRFGPYLPEPVVIHRGSWIGGNCCVLPDSQLPETSILAAGGVLTSKYAVRGVYGSVPARLIKSLGTI